MLRILYAMCAFLLFMSFYCSSSENVQAEEQKDTTPTTEEMLASMIMFGFRGSSITPQTIFANFNHSSLPFNFILFDKDVSTASSRNILSKDQLQKLTATLQGISGKGILIAVDQEGGQVRRLKPQNGFFDLESAQKMGQENISNTLEKATTLGAELFSLGINVDLAPVADVDSNPYNPLIGRLGRAFSSDPALVSAHALAFGQGLAKNHVIPVLKHFPGQGCAEKDNHLEPIEVSQCWNADIDLLPFAEIIKAGWPGMIMMGHISLQTLDPSLPASLSKNIVTGLLRQGMNWQGVIVTDDLQMKGATGSRSLKETLRLALDAGNDILLFGNNLDWDEDLPQKIWQALTDLQNEGSLTKERIHESWQRINALKKAYGIAAQMQDPELKAN